MNMIRAETFTKNAHDAVGQVRKYSLDPYWVHCFEVRDLVKTSPRHTQAMLIAALLHDTVEDTKITFEDIKRNFGIEVCKLVRELTDVSKPEDGCRAYRKSIDRKHLAKASAEAQTIKLADLISNSKDILEKDKKFAKVFLAEAELLVKVLTKGCPKLKADLLVILDSAKLLL